MTKLTLILSYILLSNFSYSQCYPDRHNSTWFDSWISCQISPNPNTARDSTHWIMYDFGSAYKMQSLSIWNINAPEILDYGIKTAIVDYSMDGIDWISYGTINLSQGVGKNEYEGESILDFKGIVAKYLLITAEENYGGNCTGFAELKLGVDSVEVVEILADNDSVCIIADVYPNPVTGQELFVYLKAQCVHAVHYSLKDATGRVLIENVPIGLGETKEILKGLELASGVYFVVLTSNYASAEYKVVKY